MGLTTSTWRRNIDGAALRLPSQKKGLRQDMWRQTAAGRMLGGGGGGGGDGGGGGAAAAAAADAAHLVARVF